MSGQMLTLNLLSTAQHITRTYIICLEQRMTLPQIHPRNFINKPRLFCYIFTHGRHLGPFILIRVTKDSLVRSLAQDRLLSCLLTVHFGDDSVWPSMFQK